MSIRQQSRGFGPFRQDFYSICSAHGGDEPGCGNCRVGSWHNRWASALGRAVYRVAPGLWCWWRNL